MVKMAYAGARRNCLAAKRASSRKLRQTGVPDEMLTEAKQ
jgi:hypothetical protein